MSGSDADEKEVGRERYRKLLSIVRANSGGPQHPLFDRAGAATIFIGHNNEPASSFRKAIRLAVDNEHLIEWTDDGQWTAGKGDGRPRLGITLEGLLEIDAMNPGSYPFGPDNLETITTIRECETECESPDSDVIGWAEQHRVTIQQRADTAEPTDTTETDATDGDA